LDTSPNDKPDAKAEARSPELKLDPGTPPSSPGGQDPRDYQQP
jgi:hypothetical protein